MVFEFFNLKVRHNFLKLDFSRMLTYCTVLSTITF